MSLYQPAETLTHWRHRLSLSQAPISHWITVRFCNGCPGGAHAGMSQGLRVLVSASERAQAERQRDPGAAVKDQLDSDE